MTTSPPDLAAGLAQMVHDVLGALGTVRLSVTAARDETDAGFRTTLLDGAEQEIRRLVGLVNALPALVGAGTDVGQTMGMPAAQLADAAVELAARRRVQLTVTEAAGLTPTRPAAAAVLAAIAVLTDQDDQGVTLAITPRDAALRIRIQPVAGRALRDEHVADLLLGALGGQRIGDEPGLTFDLPAQP